MEKFKLNIFSVLCLANITKIICTILIPFTNGATIYLSSHSVVVLLALFSDQIDYTTRIILLYTVILLWITIIILSIVSVRNKKMQNLLSIFSIIMAIFDCSLPMIFSTFEAKVVSLIVSFVIFALNVIFLSKRKLGVI